MRGVLTFVTYYVPYVGCMYVCHARTHPETEGESYWALRHAPLCSARSSERSLEAPRSSWQRRCHSSSQEVSRTGRPHGAALPGWLQARESSGMLCQESSHIGLFRTALTSHYRVHHNTLYYLLKSEKENA